MTTKSKSFKESLNPAMQFISVPSEDLKQEEDIKAELPSGYKHNPLYIETKSRRVQLLLQPSLYEKIKKKAAAHNNSINEYIHSLLENTLNAKGLT